MQSNNTRRLSSNITAQQSNDIEIENSTRREHNDKMRIATLNVGTLKKKHDELSNAMEEHRLDILLSSGNQGNFRRQCGNS